MDDQPATTDEQIKARYGAFARQVNEDGEPLALHTDGYAPRAEKPAGSLAQQLYGTEAIVDLPEAATDAALGCGNPMALATLQAGEHVLDLGSGGGIDCFMAAKAVGPTGFVIGVDTSPDMIALAKRNQQEMGLANVDFRLGRIEAPPVEAGSIDIVISNCVIDISPDKTSVFEHAYRVLKSGGRLAISDTVIIGDIPPQLKANIDQWAGAVITPLITLDAFVAYIREAGFIDIVVESIASHGLEAFDELDAKSQAMLTAGGLTWVGLPAGTGLYSAQIRAMKPKR